MSGQHDVEALLGLAPLAVGQRVRVRLSGECLPGTRHGGDFGHHGSEEGQTGFVFHIGGRSGHQYLVQFDAPLTWPRPTHGMDVEGAAWWLARYSRSELERLP